MSFFPGEGGGGGGTDGRGLTTRVHIYKCHLSSQAAACTVINIHRIYITQGTVPGHGGSILVLMIIREDQDRKKEGWDMYLIGVHRVLGNRRISGQEVIASSQA